MMNYELWYELGTWSASLKMITFTETRLESSYDYLDILLLLQ